MQTFVPHGAFFKYNAEVLDYKRLGKQRVEAWQILQTLRGESKGWANHPAVKMWAGYEPALALYGAVMCNEWKKRGYVDNMLPRFVDALNEYLDNPTITLTMPPWLYNDELVISHRSNLIRKDDDFYGPLWPDVPNNLEYVWPTQVVAA